MAKIEIITDKETEFDICPMGCGRFTDDYYGGPCTEYWKDAPTI